MSSRSEAKSTNISTKLTEQKAVSNNNNKVENIVKNNDHLNPILNPDWSAQPNVATKNLISKNNESVENADNKDITNSKNIYSINSLPLLATTALPNRSQQLDLSAVSAPVLPARKYANFSQHVGIGITAAANGRVGSLGLTANWHFLPNFSLQVGIEKVEMVRGKFDNDDDFRRKTDRNFRDLFEQGIPSTTQIKSIEFKSQFWQLPIALQYQTPRFKGFAVVASAGLALNLENESRFNYEYQTQASDDASATLRQTDQTVGLVDQLSVGLGIQKDWRRLTVQLVPTFQLPLAKPARMDRNNPTMPHEKHPDRDFGFVPIQLRLRAIYNF